MDSNTHMAVGIASSFIVLQPKADLKEIVMGTALAIMGSLISDIDITTSKANKAISKVTWIVGVAGVVSVLSDYFFNLGIYNAILNNMTIMRMIVSISLFCVIAMFAKMTAHRSFSHSIIGIAAFFIPTSLLFGEMSKYFLVAMISHIAIDMFNRKKIQLFYPVRHGVCFRLCYSNGITNKLLFYISSLYIAYEFVNFILKFYPTI